MSTPSLSAKAIQSLETRRLFLAAGRALFAELGYAGTSIDAIVERVQVTRGALYYQYRDKQALFLAVCEEIHAELAGRIEAAAGQAGDAWEALVAGCVAALDFQVRPEIRRILVEDAPSVLGVRPLLELDRRYRFGLIVQGIQAAMAARQLQSGHAPEELATLLCGAVDAAVIWVAEGDQTDRVPRIRDALIRVLGALRTTS